MGRTKRFSQKGRAKLVHSPLGSAREKALVISQLVNDNMGMVGYIECILDFGCSLRYYVLWLRPDFAVARNLFDFLDFRWMAPSRQPVLREAKT